MSKVMVVEDDASLREIYSIRITAEGYEVVSAGDGEEALAVAVREKPDLILSDVMMPKISGFDMLDILRTTPETANIKVIMMTAKSQVGIEDVVNTIHEVLGDKAPTAPAPAAPPSATTPQPQVVQPDTTPTPIQMQSQAAPVQPQVTPQAVQPQPPAPQASNGR